MRKAGIITVVVFTVLLTATVAFAADSVLYRDDELGFSFEMPSDFEYYGDVSQEVAEIVDVEKLSMQPMYIGNDSNLTIAYKKNTEGFDFLEEGLPNSVTREELDFYLVSEDEREKYAEGLSKAANIDDISVLSSSWVEYGGKLCLYAIFKGYDPETEIGCYMGSLNFIYMDHSVIITYTKYDIENTLNHNKSRAIFDECFSTLKFDVVPSNKDAKFKSGAVLRLEALVEVIIGLVSVPGIIILVVWLYKKRKKKYMRTL